MEPGDSQNEITRTAHAGWLGTAIAIYAVVDVYLIGLPILVISAALNPVLVFVVATVALTIVNVACCTWLQRQWDVWSQGGAARRVESRLEKMRSSRVMRHPVSWITRGSDAWFTLAAAVLNAIIVVTAARLVTGEPVSARRIRLAAIGYSVFFAALFSLIGLAAQDVIGGG
jgi:hypothetical protein